MICTSLLCLHKGSNFLYLHSPYSVVLISAVNIEDFAACSVISSWQASTENYNLRLPPAKGTNFYNIQCSIKNESLTIKTSTIKTVISATCNSV